MAIRDTSGAGAGGSILLVAPALTLAAGALEAKGGTPTFITQSGVTSGPGGAGRIRVDYGTVNGQAFGSNGATTALAAASSPAVGFTKPAP